jgi:hypothetical protein
MYFEAPPEGILSQGDVIDGCSILDFDPEALRLGGPPEPMAFQARVVVLSQECDLRDARTPRVVVAVVRDCQGIVQEGILKPGAIRDQLRRHLMPGWYFLPKAPDPITLPESIVDLRELHTVSKSHLETLAARGRRICRILTPWREHLNQHFAITYMRIGLPEPYDTEN